MQEAEKCSNYWRQLAFQGAESSSFHIVLLKVFFFWLFPGNQDVMSSCWTSALKLDTSLRGFAITAEM